MANPSSIAASVTGSGPGAGVRLVLLDPERRLAGEDGAWLRSFGGLALGALGAEGEVRARLVGDEEMARAHERHLGVPGTTDVITFDLSEGGALDVDLLVCVDEAARQGSALGHGPRRELLLYIVHGALHCLGFDDVTEAGAAAMHHREDEVLQAIGVGRTYAAGPSALHGGN